MLGDGFHLLFPSIMDVSSIITTKEAMKMKMAISRKMRNTQARKQPHKL